METADNEVVATARGVKQTNGTVPRSVILVASALLLTVLVVSVSGLMEAARTAQLALTLIVPATVMVVYWHMVRARLVVLESELEAEIAAERVTNRATEEFILGISHELRLHPQRCSLRSEALAVASDYRDVRPALKVAVPDVVIVSDPYLLRQLLHILVGNAARHGGDRVAIWAVAGEHSVRLSVSDDGPGLDPEASVEVSARYVDIAEPGQSIRSPGAGLAIAQALSRIMGGQLTYKRDPSWSHFSISLPLGADDRQPTASALPLEAGVR